MLGSILALCEVKPGSYCSLSPMQYLHPVKHFLILTCFCLCDFASQVDYYISQSDADNHAVREAACACIAELGSKINQDVVRPFVTSLLEGLLDCFKDDSWPVRDAACIACGKFVNCFPVESR